jgi:hypothetical protein
MQKQLAAIVASLESAQTRLHRLADQLPDARWKSRPGPGQWSAAECIEHLNLTSRAYIPLLRHALEVGTKPAHPPARYRKDFLGGLFAALVGPLPRIAKKRLGRVKTTGEFVPQPKATRVETVADFDRLQAELIAITRQAEGFPLGEMKIVSPFGGKIRYNVYSALVILWRHQERHLQQAEEAATVGKTAN